MLTGEYQYTLDPKGRLNFPARLREELGERFVVTKGLDGCLFVYGMEEWQRILEKLKELPLSSARHLQRFLASGAAEVELDKQGRILLPRCCVNTQPWKRTSSWPALSAVPKFGANRPGNRVPCKLPPI